MSRRKNLHPQRAVNVKTVVVGCREEREEEEEEQPPLVLCLKIPDVEQNHIRKEETDGGVIRKEAKRKSAPETQYPSQPQPMPNAAASNGSTEPRDTGLS